MKIQEFAQLTGLSTKTVRYNESIGKLSPPQRASNGNREYTEKRPGSGALCRGTRSLDLFLEEIREILAIQDRKEAPCRTLLNLIEQKADQIEERIRLCTLISPRKAVAQCPSVSKRVFKKQSLRAYHERNSKTGK
jgi:DNA-binding transcriptional MerR regulator